MKIDIFDLSSKKITSQPIDLSLGFDKLFDGYENVNFSKPIILKGSLNLVGDIINLEARLTTELSLACSRCLEKFSYPLEIEINEQFSRNKNNEDDDIILIEGDKLDITDTIENSIFLDLPVTKLCKEDCKGLCQHCGADLNKSSCNCTEKNEDPRFTELKNLFSSD